MDIALNISHFMKSNLNKRVALRLVWLEGGYLAGE